MKKSIFVFVATLLSVAALAQPRAIGGRAGVNDEVSYQHSIGENFVELDLGFQLGLGSKGLGGISIGTSAVYDFSIATPDWTPKGTWEFYAGPGIAFGTHFNNIPFYFGICGQIGLSYTFWFPLQLSFDLKPIFGFQTGPNSGFYVPGMFGFVPTAGVRYCFGQ